jgi:hypothetical protein
MADPSKSVGAGRLQCFQHRCHPFAQVQVGVTDDGGGGPARAVQTAGTGRGEPLDEFDFPHRTQFLRSVSTVHRTCLNEHGEPHVVSAVNIGGQLVEQISLKGNALSAKVPEVVMGIADGELRLQGRF